MKITNKFFVGKYENESCKNNYVRIYYICLIIYKEIFRVLTNIGIRNVENVFSINYFIYSFMQQLTKCGLNDDIILGKIFSEFLCKQTCANICIFINENIEAIQTKDKNNLNENVKSMDIEDFSDNKIHAIIEQIYLLRKKIIIRKKKSSGIDAKCNNDLVFFSLLITSGIWAILTGVASYLTATEYFYYLTKAAFISNIKHSKNIFKEKLYANNIELCVYNYSSINFQKIIEESLDNDENLKSKPAFFYYNYYICYDPNDDKTLPENLDENIKAEVNTILKFKPAFIAQKDSVKNFNVFVFNIVLLFVKRQILNKYIIHNVKYDNDYNSRLKKLHELITTHLKVNRIKLPKRFILKHDNMSIDENTKFFNGDKLLDQCVFKNYRNKNRYYFRSLKLFMSLHFKYLWAEEKKQFHNLGAIFFF